MQIIFKTAEVPDIPLIRDLANRIWPATFRSILSPEQIHYMMEWMYAEKQLHEEITRLNVRYDLLCHAEQPVGYVAFGPAPQTDDLKLHKLYVLPEYQRHGLGRMALERVAESARNRGCRYIILQVNRHNEQAIAAYRKYGFRTREEAVTHIGNGFVMDDFILEYPVRPS